jgi:hypothetical protein
VLPEVLEVVWCGAGRPLAHHKEDGGAQVQEAVPAPAPHSTQGPQRKSQAHQPWTIQNESYMDNKKRCEY